jgi:hypothetical protein
VPPSARPLCLFFAITPWLGCTSGTSAPTPPSASSPQASANAAPASAAATAGGVRPDEGGPPEPVSVPTIAKLCGGAACAGPFSRVRVFYKGNAIYRYAHDGDLQKCSHPPTTVFEKTGKEVGGIAEEPIVRGSAREKEVEAHRASLFGDSKHVVTFDCSGKHLGPGVDVPK